MMSGACHCGSASWKLDAVPEIATACNCTLCHRYGVLWAYGIDGDGVSVTGATSTYVPDGHLAFHSCTRCACLTHWRTLEPGDDGRHRIAVNLRLADVDAVSSIAIRRFDGLDSFNELPGLGRCVGHYLA